MERNEEVEEIKHKILLCVVVFIFVVAIGLIFVFNRFGYDNDAVLDAVYHKDSFVVFFRDDASECPNCDMVLDTLNELGVSYYNFNIRSSSYSEILTKLNINYEIKVPAIYVIEEGSVRFNITNIQNKESVQSFVQSHDLVSFSN